MSDTRTFRTIAWINTSRGTVVRTFWLYNTHRRAIAWLEANS